MFFTSLPNSLVFNSLARTLALLNQEHDVGIMLFFDDTLESVVTIGGVSAAQCLFQHLRSGDYTISYFYSRDSDSLLPTVALNSRYSSDLAISGT